MKKLAVILLAFLTFSTIAPAQWFQPICSGSLIINDDNFVTGDYYTVEGRVEPQGVTPTSLYLDVNCPYTSPSQYNYSFTVSEYVYIPNPLTQIYFNIRLKVGKFRPPLAPTYQWTSSTIAKYNVLGTLTAESVLEVKF